MVSLDDWSELVTVNYRGGYCGDFFCTLLKEAIDNQPIEYRLDKNYRFSFGERCVFNNELKTLSYFHGWIIHTLELNPYEVVPKFYNIYKKFYDEGFNTKEYLVEKIRTHLYDKYKQNFDGSLKVGMFHNPNNEDFSLQQIFPKSKNIVLLCPDWFFNVTRVLFYVKTLKDNKSRNDFLSQKKDLPDIEKFFQGYFDPGYISINANDEYVVDIFDLFFDDVNYDQKLSDFLGIDIKLNKDNIKFYRDKNVAMLNSYGIDPYAIHKKQHYVDMALKHFKDACIDNTILKHTYVLE